MSIGVMKDYSPPDLVGEVSEHREGERLLLIVREKAGHRDVSRYS
jgi:hypothetical protein